MKNYLLKKDDQFACQFCNKPCKQGSGSADYTWVECKSCPADFLVSERGEIGNINFSYSENKKLYVLHVYPQSEISDVYIYDEVGLQLVKKDFFTVKAVANVTPQNLKEKLKKYILFS